MAAKKKYKIIGISGSPREGNTNYMLRTVLDATTLEYELVLLKDKKINSCRACGGCFQTHKCIVKDGMRELYEKLPGADIVVLGSPVYFGNVTGLMKNFIDRCLPLYLAERLKGKKAALLASGNFKKDEVRFLDGFDIDKVMADKAQRKELEKPVKRCLDILNNFCASQMGMEVVGRVAAIGGKAELKEKELAKLGQKLIS